MKLKGLYIYFILISISGYSQNPTSYLGGYISINVVGTPKCFGASTYDIKIVLDTHRDSLPPSSIQISTGDGAVDTALKTDSFIIGNQVMRSVYSLTYAYLGCGTYEVSYFDTINKINATNFSSPKLFYISTTFYISPFFSTYSSPIFYDGHLMSSKNNDSIYYNLSAIDTNYDSLLYSFADTATIPNNMSINKYSGEVRWKGVTNNSRNYIFVLVNKYKDGIKIGASLKSFSIYSDSTVFGQNFSNINNWNVNSNNYYEYKILANQQLQLFFNFIDTISDSTSIIGVSELLNISNKANFSEVTLSPKEKIALFDWTPTQNEIRKYPYNFIFICRSYKDTIEYDRYITVSIYVENPSFVSELKESRISFSHFPNPAEDYFNVEIVNPDEEELNLSLYNLLGEKLYHQEFSSHYHKEEISTQALAKGVYIISLQTKSGQYIKQSKLVVR